MGRLIDTRPSCAARFQPFVAEPRTVLAVSFLEGAVLIFGNDPLAKIFRPAPAAIAQRPRADRLASHSPHSG